MEISSSNARALGGEGDVSPRFGEKADERLSLEQGDDPRLSVQKTLLGSHADRGRFLAVEVQMLDLDLSARGEHDGALDAVLELPEIAGPRIALHEVERLR